MRNFLLALPALALACTSPDTQPTDDGTTANHSLASTFGGQTTTDEPPQFGDPILQTAPLAAEDPAVADSTTSTEPGRIRLLVAWGYIKPHPDATEVVDWSGSI